MLGKGVQRVCVATTHIPCKDSQGGLRRVGQVMAVLSAAADLLKRNWGMVFGKSRVLDVFSLTIYDDLLMSMPTNELCSFLYSSYGRLQRVLQ